MKDLKTNSEIIKAEPCGINRTLYLNTVQKYDKPVMPKDAYTHDDLRKLAGLPVENRTDYFTKINNHVHS